MDSLTYGQYSLVQNAFSFTIAVMFAATVYFFLGRSQVAPAYRNAITITGLVTLIAGYHYFRILNSWEGAFTVSNQAVTASDSKFNDVYRYVDWLLTVPLLLIELILVMRLSPVETTSRATRLGVLAALMIILGYPGEISAVSGTRWLWWGLAMIPFLIIVFELFVGLKKSLDSQPEAVRGLINQARWLTIISWCFYPIVFVFPMIGFTGGAATTAVQVGYTICDIVSKAVFGVLIYTIASRKSAIETLPQLSVQTG